MKRLHVLPLAAVLLTGSAASAQTVPGPLVVYSAGSMTGALGAMLKRYTAETGQQTDLHTGPAGLMRERIEAGDKVDLFVSANMAHPQKLRLRARQPRRWCSRVTASACRHCPRSG
jgi:molybdate transport system substrate-binding protein